MKSAAIQVQMKAMEEINHFNPFEDKDGSHYYRACGLMAALEFILPPEQYKPIANAFISNCLIHVEQFTLETSEDGE